MEAHTCNLSTQKVEKGGSGFQGQPGLHDILSPPQKDTFYNTVIDWIVSSSKFVV